MPKSWRNCCGSFNSRLREEATLDDDDIVEQLISFNSRLREEATAVHPKLHYSKNVSTHASVRRRPACAKPLARADEFQLTPP